MTTTIYTISNKTGATVSLGGDRLLSTTPVYLMEGELTGRILGMYERGLIDILPKPLIGGAPSPAQPTTLPPPVQPNPTDPQPNPDADCRTSGGNGMYTKPCQPTGPAIPIPHHCPAAPQTQLRWPKI